MNALYISVLLDLDVHSASKPYAFSICEILGQRFSCSGTLALIVTSDTK